jgi:type I restriction enzyme S subunit
LKASDYSKHGVPIVSVAEIGFGTISISKRTPRVPASVTASLPKYILKQGDIVFARKGAGTAVERSALVREKEEGWFLGSDSIRIRLPEVCDPQYVSYWLQSKRHRQWMISNCVGTTMPALNQTIIERIPILLPDKDTQFRISYILGSLDDKIELNRRMHDTLEATMRTIFKSWFVDFDPVRAKVEGRRPARIGPDIAVLFPDSFQNSPLGLVPKGWQIAPLGEHAEAVKGLSYKGTGLSETGLPLHNLNSVYEGGGYKYEGIKYYQGEYRERHILHPGDVIVANTEQGHNLLLIGYPAIVPQRFGQMGLFSHHLYRVRPVANSPLTLHFIYLLLMTQRFRDEVTGYTNGTTVNMLSVEGLQRPLLVIPPGEVVARFEQIVDPLFRKAEQLHDESPVLAAVRGALLPKLLSGNLRVKDAERVLEKRT